MKILFCNKYNFPFSGTEVYLFELMALLRSHGHEVALFSMADDRGAPSALATQLPPAVDFKSAKHSIFARMVLAGHVIYSPQMRRSLRQVIAEFRPDVAHVRNVYHHLSPSILWELRAQGIPVLYHLNDFKLICPSYNLVSRGKICERCRSRRFWHVLTSGCYEGMRGSSTVLAAEAYIHKWFGTYRKCVTRFLAPSNFVRDKLVENGWDARLIDVLYHLQTAAQEVPPPPPAGAPVLYFGRLSPEKGLVDLVHAIHRLPQIRLQIAGEGPQITELQALANRLGLSNVEFLGHLSGKQLDDAILGAQFTVLPSLAYETLGKSILESYAKGRPVIATDLGSRRELVADGNTGLLYPASDRDALAAALGRLHGNAEPTRRMGEAGYQLVRERHSPEKHYEALLEVYTRLTKGRAGCTTEHRLRHPPRVAFIGGRGVACKYSGIESWYEEVGRRLARSGHQVTAYCRSYFTPPISQYDGIRIVRLPTIRTKHLDTFVHTALATLHAIFSRYDIVHYHALGPALFSLLPRLVGKRTIVTVQGLDWRRRKWGTVAAHFLRLGEKAAIALPNATTVVSRTLQAYYRDRYDAETTYIPNGSELRDRTTVRYLPQWGLQSGRYVLFLGRFSPEKGCDLLVRAFEPIKTDIKLVLAGGSSYSDEYTSDLRRHQSSRVVLLDWVSGQALEELLTHAVLFVLPSDLEDLSLALLDAMAAGVCALASDVPENRELVEGAGFTFRPGDVQDLRDKLCTLIGNAELRRQSANAGRQRVRDAYLWSGVTSQIERLYQQVLEPLPRQTPDRSATPVRKRAA